MQTFTAFLLSVVAGVRRFAHSNLLRAAVALHASLGISRFPVDDIIRNLFKRFGQGQCQSFWSGLWSWQLERLWECGHGDGLDLDSTVRSAAACVVRAEPTSMDGPRIIRSWRC
jgi:hypothetical protein